MRLSPILTLVVATTLIRLAFAATTGLGVDESYMVAAGRVLCLGYFDHPPTSWWLSWGAAHLLGSEAPVVVRLPFILLFAVSQALVWRIGCLLADRRSGFWAAAALNLSPVFGVTTATWVLPDGPLDAALLGAALCLLQALAPPPIGAERGPPPPQRIGWWAGAGLCAGVALFSKYTAVLTIGGAGLYLLTSRRDRMWLRRPGPWIAGVLALAVFAPVPLWNAAHGWASFAFQGDRAAGFRFRPLLPLATLGGEALFVLPWIWLPLVLLFITAFRLGARWQERLLAWLAAPPIVGFALISAWSSQRILFHWAAPGYLMLFPLLGQVIAARIGRTWVRQSIAATAVIVVVVMTVIATQLQFDWLRGSLAAVMRRDPTAEGLDWTSVRNDLHSRGLLVPGAVVGVLNWRDGGKIGYSLGPDTVILCLNRDARQFGFAHPLRAFAGRDVLLVALEPPERAAQAAGPWFQRVSVLPPSSIRLDGRELQSVTVLRGMRLRPPP